METQNAGYLGCKCEKIWYVHLGSMSRRVKSRLEIALLCKIKNKVSPRCSAACIPASSVFCLMRPFPFSQLPQQEVPLATFKKRDRLVLPLLGPKQAIYHRGWWTIELAEQSLVFAAAACARAYSSNQSAEQPAVSRLPEVLLCPTRLFEWEKFLIDPDPRRVAGSF